MANILIVHQNFPGQFPFIAQALLQRGHKVAAIGGPTAKPMPGVDFRRWKLSRASTKGIYLPVVRAEADLLRADAAVQVALQLRKDGFIPDVIVAHPQWGETLHFNIIFPDARQVLFGELYYHAKGLDYGFDPEFTMKDESNDMRINAKNATQALAFLSADVIVCPTPFQASTFPKPLQPLIKVMHEGVDTGVAKKQSNARITLNGGRVLDGSKPVVTFINRTLEPMRGFHILMRALPAFLAACPDAEVVLIGGEEGSGYGTAPTDGKSWKSTILAELGDRLDLKRVHFLGRVPHKTMIRALSISWAHVYYTYPFVLSWSLLEAMACECLVIASDTPPLRDAITNGKDGILLDFFDTAALSDALIGAARAPAAFLAMRRLARETAVKRFDLATVGIQNWVRVVERAVAA